MFDQVVIKCWSIWLAFCLQQRDISQDFGRIGGIEVIHLALLFCHFSWYEWHFMLNCFLFVFWPRLFVFLNEILQQSIQASQQTGVLFSNVFPCSGMYFKLYFNSIESIFLFQNVYNRRSLNIGYLTHSMCCAYI